MQPFFSLFRNVTCLPEFPIRYLLFNVFFGIVKQIIAYICKSDILEKYKIITGRIYRKICLIKSDIFCGMVYEMKQTALVVMAAGIGSRFGKGIKQLERV